jgi:hypothetical protein
MVSLLWLFQSLAVQQLTLITETSQAMKNSKFRSRSTSGPSLEKKKHAKHGSGNTGR